MWPRVKAFLTVLTVAIVCIIVIFFALQVISAWILFSVLGALASIGVWLWKRRICCYVCHRGVANGSSACWIDGRKRLICLNCERINMAALLEHKHLSASSGKQAD